MFPQVHLEIPDKEELLDKFRDIFDAGWLSEGPFTKKYIEACSAYLKIPHLLPVPNGTLGLYLALSVAKEKWGLGDILIPSFTFYGSATPAVALGFNPVFVDCNRATFQSDLAQFASRATPSTVGIMPIHVYGQLTEMSELCNWAKEKGYFIIEDCAQAFGAEINGVGAGTFGDIAVFSTYSDKALPTGEGGLIGVHDPELFRQVKLKRNQGRENSGTFTHEALGMNFRITDMQAAIGLHFLARYSEELQRRRKIYNIYREQSELRGIETMFVSDINSMVPFRFPVVSNDFEKTRLNLERNGFQTRGFFNPLHRQPKFIEVVQNSLPNSEDISSRGFCLPVHSLVSEAVIEEQLKCIV